ncbi:MAG TPA: glycosyltransferase WbuB, partial [Lachnospiraceae bacterium]|nr:glycosyltransferase WbuB [Lachnospiraceae bacterium]
NQKRDVPKATVYVGNELSVFDSGAEKTSGHIMKPEEEFWVTYAGTIGTSYDIRTMLLGAEELAKRGKENIKIKILGGGPLKDELEALARDKKINNAEFVGYAPYDKMAAYLKKSDILVNSFVRKAPQSIVTKIGDYLAAGKAMINTCMSPEFRNKVENDGFGVNIEPEDAGILADAIEDLYRDEEKRLEMGRKARQIAEEQFDRPKSYRKIEELIRKLI